MQSNNSNKINESKGMSLLPKFLTNLFSGAPAAAAAPNAAARRPAITNNVLKPVAVAPLNPAAPEYVPMTQRSGLNPAAPEYVPQSAGRRRRAAHRTLNKKRKASVSRRRRDRR
jgi:hypothetical protein